MLSGFIERLLDAPTIADIRAVFLEAVGQLGYDHALYAARFMLTVPRALLRDNPVVFSNLPTLLHKSGDGRGSPFPGRTYPTASVTGMPSAVYPFRTAIRTWSSAT